MFIVPLLATAYFIYISFSWLDDQLNLPYPGLGFIIIFSVITLIGYLSTNYIFKTVGRWFDAGMNRIPLVKIIYSTVRDLLSAVVGDKRKFNKPVLVRVNKENDLHQIGFITQSDLTGLGLHDMVVVYFPHAYAISGYHLFCSEREYQNVTHLRAGGHEIHCIGWRKRIKGLGRSPQSIEVLCKGLKPAKRGMDTPESGKPINIAPGRKRSQT